MKHIPLLLFIFQSVLGITQDPSETYYYRADNNTVMAHSGLNIRNKPNLKSDIVGKIPFGEQVQILHKDHYGYQKLNTINTQTSKVKIDGFWLKIKYKNWEGFVLSTFLYRAGYYDYLEPYTDYVLLFPGGGCLNNIHNINLYNWYGLYEEGNNLTFKPISFEYYNVADRMLNMKIVAKENKNLSFIIGSKEELKPFIKKKKRPLPNIYEQDIFSNKCDTTYNLSPSIIAEYSIENKPNGGSLVYFIKQNNKYYELKPGGQAFNHTNIIYFVGDLDSDGHDDYIYSIGEKQQHIFLFLSSEKNNGGILKDVAVFHSGYCC